MAKNTKTAVEVKYILDYWGQGAWFYWLYVDGEPTGVYCRPDDLSKLRRWVKKVGINRLRRAVKDKMDSDDNYSLEFYLYGYNAPSWSETV